MEETRNLILEITGSETPHSFSFYSKPILICSNSSTCKCFLISCLHMKSVLLGLKSRVRPTSGGKIRNLGFNMWTLEPICTATTRNISAQPAVSRRSPILFLPRLCFSSYIVYTQLISIYHLPQAPCHSVLIESYSNITFYLTSSQYQCCYHCVFLVSLWNHQKYTTQILTSGSTSEIHYHVIRTN